MLSTKSQKIIPLRNRHIKGIRALEAKVYPSHMVLGEELLDDVIKKMSSVVIDAQKNVVAYVLVEQDEECCNALYVADIVRTRGSDISGLELLEWVIQKFLKSKWDFVTAECRSGSVKFIQQCGLPVLDKRTVFCNDMQEEMVIVKVGKPHSLQP